MDVARLRACSGKMYDRKVSSCVNEMSAVRPDRAVTAVVCRRGGINMRLIAFRGGQAQQSPDATDRRRCSRDMYVITSLRIPTAARGAPVTGIISSLPADWWNLHLPNAFSQSQKHHMLLYTRWYLDPGNTDSGLDLWLAASRLDASGKKWT